MVQHNTVLELAQGMERKRCTWEWNSWSCLRKCCICRWRLLLLSPESACPSHHLHDNETLCVLLLSMLVMLLLLLLVQNTNS